MTPVESYLADLCAVRGAGTAETSGYPALANLLNEVGGALKPVCPLLPHGRAPHRRGAARRGRPRCATARARGARHHHLIERGANYFPVYLSPKDTSPVVRETPDMFADGGGSGDGQPVPNLTPFARDYLARLGAQPEDLFFHIVALLHAPAYRTENAGALRQDWPRVPLPPSAGTLLAGAALGRQVAALLDPEIEVAGVTDKKPRRELSGLGELTVTASAKSTPDLRLVARWGYAGQGGVVMPGPGAVRTGTRGNGFVDIHLNASTR